MYGINTEVAGNLIFLDEQHLIYSIGTNIICFNMELRSQTFIPAADEGFEIMAMACGIGKTIIAVAARNVSEQRSVIYLIEVATFKRKKTVELPDDGGKVLLITRDMNYQFID